ncbi:MAG: VRR-NUC domain-containing protein [Bacteroidales bacterium]|nr:VRR-NUC domain-containing protein [Bacteroidales bacterium]
MKRLLLILGILIFTVSLLLLIIPKTRAASVVGILFSAFIILYSKKYKPVEPLTENEINIVKSIIDNSEAISQNFNNINENTIFINAKKSGHDKKSEYYVSDTGQYVSTEEYVKEYYQNAGFKVLRTEVSFWQAVTTLFFWNVIYNNEPCGGNDIPRDIFTDSFFKRNSYMMKSYLLNNYRNSIKEIVMGNLNRYNYKKYFSRLVNDGKKNIEENNELVREFLDKIDVKQFFFIAHTILRDLNNNRAGLPDFIVWKGSDLFHVEVKRKNEKLRETQLKWINLFENQEIKYKIIRVCNEK